jgi:putative tryptophan/tyrosine transport system substrate-binding protein
VAPDFSFGSYGPAIEDIFRRAATYVDRILRGAEAAGPSCPASKQFVRTVNLKTARTHGLTIPETRLTTADEVID